MAKKFGKEFYPKKLSQLKSLRRTDRVSFYIRPPKLQFEDTCNTYQIRSTPDLSIFGKRGRQQGTTILYDPVQVKNYLSVSARYERSLKLAPDKIEKKDNGEVCYFFCSDGSPTGFWEVCTKGSDAFIEFTPPTLNIICPRPFQLRDLIDIETDANFITWQQSQGRATVISPTTGEGSLNPFISIIGQRSPYDPPILIFGEADGDPTVFDVLAINTTIREILDSYEGGIGKARLSPCKSVPCRLRVLPQAPNTVVCIGESSIEVSWFPPTCSVEWVEAYSVQVNSGGTWLEVESGINPSKFILQENTHYRILTLLNILGVRKEVSVSCIFDAADIGRGAIATDTNFGEGGFGKLRAKHYLIAPLVKRLAPDSDTFGEGGIGRLQAKHYLVAPLIKRIEPERDTFGEGGIGRLQARHYKLGAIVAG